MSITKLKLLWHIFCPCLARYCTCSSLQTKIEIQFEADENVILFTAALELGATGINVIQDRQGGDFLLVGYFGVHCKNVSQLNHCGKLNVETGIVHTEAMRYAIDKINRRSVLFGKRLGYRIVDTCKNTATLRRSFFSTWRNAFYMGVVGPPTSDEAILAATVHSAHKSAVVSPSASSTVFEDRLTYHNFFSTVPSDTMQIFAFIDIIKYFNWTYISTVNSYGTYGQRAMENFIQALKSTKICVAKRVNLPMNPKSSDYEKKIVELSLVTNARVVIMFTTSEDTRGILTAAANVKTLNWVSSASWHAGLDSVKGVEESANGSLILQYGDTIDEEFSAYFMNLTLKANNHTWFREFWSDVFDCNAVYKNNSKRACTGEENLRASSFNGKYLAVKPVINAVESIICGLQNGILYRCPTGNLSCINYIYKYFYSFEEDVAIYLKNSNTTCQQLNNSVSFNTKGFYLRNLKILNFDGKHYRNVGLWEYNETLKRGSLRMDTSRISWKDGVTPKSICSLPCKTGEVEVHSNSESLCCFTCKACGINHIVSNNTCMKCQIHEKATVDKRTCFKLPFVYITINRVLGWVTLIGSWLGIILNTFILTIFIRHRNSRIVKASSRELCFIILIALYICFASPFAFLMRPSKVVCGLQRFIVGISLTGCYTPLMLKTNRIFRIFKAAQTMVSKPMLVSSKSQILICVGLICVQLLLGIMWVVGDSPTVVKQHIKNDTEVAVICKFDALNVILNLIPCFVLMAICTVFAFKTRKFPSNFNEASSIGITMYISCFIWGVFIPLISLLAFDKENVFVITFVISGFTIIVGFVTLLGLFGPKVKKIFSHVDIGPMQEFYSDFQRRSILARPVSLATIHEDESCEGGNRTSTVRFRAVTKDVGTNT